MIKKLLPVILALIGLGGGIGVGKMLQPPHQVVELNPCGDGQVPVQMAATDTGEATAEETGNEYVKLNNQFVIPDVQDERVTAMIVVALSLEVESGGRELVYQQEPKLRDVFLQVLFDHANAGGFRGTFTNSRNMTELRNALREIAQKTVGDKVLDVLIIDIVRQDVG